MTKKQQQQQQRVSGFLEAPFVRMLRMRSASLKTNERIHRSSKYEFVYSFFGRI